jgi:RNA-directed DNA polymerase
MTTKATSRPEGRPQPSRIARQAALVQTQSWIPRDASLVRVNEAAKRSRQIRFTALFHHLTEEALLRAFRRLKRNAAPGVDGLTVETYEVELADNLHRLHAALHSGQYWPQPVLRTYIPKADGGRRPLGLTAIEDKIVQSSVAEILSAVYEADFSEASFGFRPGRSAHQALQTTRAAIMTERVNWIVDADIRNYFGTIDQSWMMRMVAHRIADPRMLRLLSLWLKAGVMEDGVRTSTDVGTPQGSGISPVLANIYLHYVLDLWVGQWSRRHSTGTIRLVRYADDFLLLTQRKQDAEQLLAELATRFSQYGLTLHEEKTRLLAFGRYAVGNSAGGPARSGSPTFSFLGFTFYMGKSLAGYLVAKLKTQRERMISKLKVLRREMKARRHMTVAEQQQWLTSVLRGYYAYYGITGNARDIARFYLQVVRWWHWVLRRRGQRPKLPWERFNAILSRHPLPTPRIVHDWRRAVAG